jgi:hypothetical protein
MSQNNPLVNSQKAVIQTIRPGAAFPNEKCEYHPPSPIKEESMPRRPPRQEWEPPIPISVERNGVTHKGHYELETHYSKPQLRMIRVTGEGGSKTTHLSASPPQSLARLLLSEIVAKI